MKFGMYVEVDWVMHDCMQYDPIQVKVISPSKLEIQLIQ